MARIRSIHPGLFTDEAFMEATANPSACIFLMGLWGQADDKGAFEWKPITLKARILPATTESGSALLAFLAGLNFIAKYEDGGKPYGAIRNFCKFQRPKKPNSIYPMPDEWRIYAGSSVENKEVDPDEGDDGSPPVPYQFPTSTEFGPQREEEGGDKEEGKEERTEATPPAPSVAVAVPDFRKLAWEKGKRVVSKLTGMPEREAGAFVGKMAGIMSKDFSGMLALFREAEESPPLDAKAWFIKSALGRATGAVRPGKPEAFADFPETADARFLRRKHAGEIDAEGRELRPSAANDTGLNIIDGELA